MMVLESQNGSNGIETPSFNFIRNRIDAASDETQETVARLLEEVGGSRRALFVKLVELLDDTPSKFTADESMLAVEKLAARDTDAREDVARYASHENASRDSVAMRPDMNQPTPLEWFFLTIPSVDIPTARNDWKRLCQTLERLPEMRQGVLSLQNVTQNVLSDQPRTKAFVQEVSESVTELKNTLKRPVVVYDIGCGPFPVLAIAAAIADSEAQITCIERNPLSARIATFIIESLGLTNIRLIHDDALSEKTISEINGSKIDLLISETFGSGLLDEPAIPIFKAYAPHLSPEGRTIPAEAYVSATLFPLNKGVTFVEGKLTEKYPEIVLNVDGSDIPRIPDKDWQPVEGGNLVLSQLSEKNPLSGTLRLPKGVSLAEFNNNYCVCLCAELNLGKRKLSRYASFPTFPLRLDVVSIPEHILKANPPSETISIKYSYTPGSDSSIFTPRYEVIQDAA